MKKSFFILALLACTLLSCNKDKGDIDNPDDPKQPETSGSTLSLSTQDLVFEAAGGWKEFTINCSDAWTLTGGNAWCQLGMTSGSGKSQIKVWVEASTLTSDRNVNLTVRSGSQSKVLTVTQKGVDALTLTKDKFDVSAEGEDITVTLQANVECTSTIPSAFQSWIKKATGTKAITSQSFRFTVSPNESAGKREGYIVFNGGSLKDTVYVYQAQQNCLILSEDTYEFTSAAQEMTVELKTNIDYEIIVPDSVSDWMHYIDTRAIRTDKLRFSIDENETGKNRSAVIIVKEQNGKLSDTLHIRQALKMPTATFSQTEYTCDFFANTTAVEFSVSVPWQATITYTGDASGWLTLSATQGEAGAAKFTASATQNSSTTSREAYINITYGILTQRLILTQDAQPNDQTDITAKFDPDFARVLQEKGDIPNATKITLGDVNKKTEIRIDDSQLTSLRGIEYFTALTKLFCRSNQLTSLNISRNLALTEVYCEKNQLSALDVSQNTKLIKLYCWENRISLLDVSKNFALTELDCDINQLATLDVSKNTELTLLYCSRNLFSTINVSENSKLTRFSCTDGKLVALNLDKNTKLTEVKCHNNPGNGTVFPLIAWFDENNLPKELKTEWTYSGKRITLQITTK